MGSLAVLDGQPITYPKARRDDSVVDNYHGFHIPDPYRWLEDPDSIETKEFVKNQVSLTNSVLEKCDDARMKIRDRIKELFNHPRYTPPFKRGDCYFYWCNSGLQPQNVLYYVQDSIDGNPEVLLDPNELSIDGTISLNICAVSEDAQYLAYGLSSSGSDWVNIQVMTVNDKTVLSDYISWVKFSSIAWTHDSKGFFYSRFPTPKEGEKCNGTETNVNLHHQLYYHYLGTDQSEDILCWYDSDNPKQIFTASVTEDGKYVILYIEMGCEVNKKVYYLDLTSLPGGTLLSYRGNSNSNSNSNSLPFVKFIDKFEASYNLIANDDTIFTFLTNKDAPRYKLTRVDITSHDHSWTDIILPESNNDDVLESAHAVNGDKILVKYLSNVKCVLKLHDFNTGCFLQTLPIDIGTVHCVSTRRKDKLLFIGFTSFLTPGIIYQYDLNHMINPDHTSDQLMIKIFREISVPKFDRTEFQVKQVFVPSKDGSTKIPAFVVAHNDIVLDGSNPCLMFGYGGFNVKVTPCFSVARAVLLKHLGLVFVIANVRGGGEYGEEWHKAGSLGNKQNCFDDFVAVAEYLVDKGYTSPKKLCVEGGSNGGLLVGACINQRPDLFGCALAHVGVMDMLRYHKFTIGHAWACDFGCSDNLEEFHWLIKYSPLHNVKRPWETSSSSSSDSMSSSSPLQATNQYPATMLLTADHDNRVVPLHSLKMLATMQYVLCTSVERSPQTNPILARIECKAGHGCGRPTQKLIDEAADRYGFMATMLDSIWIE